MTNFYAYYPPTAAASAVPTYANFASFPSASSAGNGALAIALDTDILYISNGTMWEVLANPSYSSAITSLTGDVTATGPGAAAASLVATSNGTLTTLNALTTASSLASVGTITSGNWQGTAIAIAHGGTGNTSASAAFAALSPLTTAGDIIYENATPTPARLAIGSSGQILTVAAGLPAWSTPSYANAITALTGDVTATGPGSVSATLAATSNNTLTTLSALTTASNLASIGTVTSGTWNATTIAINHGGTGVTSLGNLTESTSSVLTITGGTGAVIDNTTIQVKQAGTSQSGYLSSTDWNTFNNKQGAFSGLTTDGIIYATSSSAVASTSAGSQYQAMIANSSGAPTFQALNLAQSAAVTGTLGVTNGGTGVTSSTGSVAVVLSNSPTLVTPNIGAATGTSLDCSSFVEGATLLATSANGTNYTSTSVLDFSSGSSRFLSYGANSSTNGTFSWLGITNSGTSTTYGSINTSAQWTIGLTSGTFSGNLIYGTNNATSATSGTIGETIVAGNYRSQSGAISLTSTSAVTIASIALSAGDWDIDAFWGATVSGGTISSMDCSINTTTNTAAPITAIGYPTSTGQFRCFAPATTGTDFNMSVPSYALNISSSTTLYLVVLATFSGTSTGYGYIKARRRH